MESDSKVISLSSVRDFKNASQSAQNLWVQLMDRGIVNKSDSPYVLTAQFDLVSILSERQIDMAATALEKWGASPEVKDDFSKAIDSLQMINLCFKTKLKPKLPRI